jgi:hypothetical protein
MSSIVTLLNQIKQEEIVLPAIQRDFVWPEDKVLRLLDSIMRGYPIGIALLWETYLDLQYRKFADDFQPGAIHAFKDNKHKKKLKLVLDGQQRLQSLYIALYGSYEGKSLYFDVLSGRESDDLSDEKYEFEFLDKEGIKRWESQMKTKVEAPGSSQEGEQKYLLNVADLFTAGVRGRDALAKQIKKQVKLSEDDEGRLGENLARFHDALTSNASILMVSVIDENLQSDHSDRKSEADVLEIFVRVNREGMQLSKSDLIFSMLKLNWRESAESLPEFVRKINEGNSFDLDTDFVIRCLFAVSDLGTKFDLDLLRKKNNVDLLRKNFQDCCDAIRSVVDSVSRECWCTSSSLLGGQTTLVPFVYYLYHAPKHEVPTGQIDAFRKALYMSAFARPFSRYADSRLWKFIRKEIRPLVEKKDYRFPFSRLVSRVSYWESVTGFNERLLQSNVPLTLHVLQNLSTNKVKFERNAGQVDHIFPRAELRKKEVFEESEINHFGNFWILAKGKNQNKSDKHPAKFFEDVSDNEMNRAIIDRDMLDYPYTTTLLEVFVEREPMPLGTVSSLFTFPG